MNHLYVTPKMIKSFHRQFAKKKEETPSFSEMLMLMKERGLLSPEMPDVPQIDGKMSKEAFMEAYDNIPFEVNQQFDTFSREREDNERVIFPPDKDILCMQQLHHNLRFDQTIRNVYAFTYVYKGSCSYSFQQQTLTIRPGDIFIATPGFSHQIYTASGTFALVIMCNSTMFQSLFHDFLTANSVLSDFFRQAVSKNETGNYCVIRTDPQDEETRFYLQSMICESLSDNVYSGTNAASLLKLFLSRAYQRYSDRLTIYRRDFPGVRADVKEIIRYIRSNYQSITLQQVADHFHYNRTYISRFIHAHYGKTYIEIINELKIEHAMEYLSKTSLRILEISGLVGFESYDHFCRTFKKYTGMTPRAYRSVVLK